MLLNPSAPFMSLTVSPLSASYYTVKVKNEYNVDAYQSVSLTVGFLHALLAC